MKDYSKRPFPIFDLDIIDSIMINKLPPPALLILDPQNDFFGADNPNLRGFLQTVPVINRLLDTFHHLGWPVIVVQHVSKSKPEGSEGWKIYAAFHITAADFRFSKRNNDAFYGTPLDGLLRSLPARRLVIAGYAAEQCVTATYRTACSLGYLPVVLADGTASLEGDLPKILQGMERAPLSRIITILKGERKTNG